ncbi:hypothetical protein CVT26_016086 [Gymnopilus dilepis]|uniref:FAD-binding domain-containing protein n=1 Tax=Gymnopilus dilepis TaxID=231916 RepID=A0A409YDZ0_9AGAR|nr:hypothetical protein CVT26_016086 [Gymnopilus dilepis]
MSSPTRATMYPDRPGVRLDIVVVGGGIAGISAAYALAKAGHNVTVVDKGNGVPKGPRAVRGGPNLTKTLMQWGLAPTLRSIAQVCSRIDWRSGIMTESLGSMVLTQDFFQDFHADFLLMEQAELWSALKSLADMVAVDCRFNTRVTCANSETGSVSLHTGEEIYGDLIIAADGYNSALRPVVTDEEEIPTHDEEYLILSLTVPTSQLKEDEELRSLLEDSSVWSFWIGGRYIIQGNALHEGRDYTMTLQFRCKGPLGNIPQGDWKSIGSLLVEKGFELNQIESRVIKILSSAKTISPSVIPQRSSIETLICENSRIVLAGEAGHPALPGVHHSQALSIEDAETLGNLFSRIQRKEQVSQLLTAYNEIRQPWCKFAVDHLYTNQVILEAEPGPIQEARDAKVRAMLVQIAGDHMDEALFREIWGNELALFAYDAKEKVDDWWCQYGSFIVRSPHRDSILSSIAVSISQASV